MYQRHNERGYLGMIFIQRVKEFIEFATEQETYQTNTKIKCPCAKSWNVPYSDVDTMMLHLYSRAFGLSTMSWVCYGEALSKV